MTEGHSQTLAERVSMSNLVLSTCFSRISRLSFSGNDYRKLGGRERGWTIRGKRGKGEKTDDAFISLKKERARDSTNIQHLQRQKGTCGSMFGECFYCRCRSVRTCIYGGDTRGMAEEGGGEGLKACFYKLTIAS